MITHAPRTILYTETAFEHFGEPVRNLELSAIDAWKTFGNMSPVVCPEDELCISVDNAGVMGGFTPGYDWDAADLPDYLIAVGALPDNFNVRAQLGETEPVHGSLDTLEARLDRRNRETFAVCGSLPYGDGTPGAILVFDRLATVHGNVVTYHIINPAAFFIDPYEEDGEHFSFAGCLAAASLQIRADIRNFRALFSDAQANGMVAIRIFHGVNSDEMASQALHELCCVASAQIFDDAPYDKDLDSSYFDGFIEPELIIDPHMDYCDVVLNA